MLFFFDSFTLDVASSPFLLDAQTIPQVPFLLEPIDGAQTTGESDAPLGVPKLAWQPVPEATQYRVQVSASAGFADPVVNQTTYATTYTPLNALPDGEYF